MKRVRGRVMLKQRGGHVVLSVLKLEEVTLLGKIPQRNKRNSVKFILIQIQLSTRVTHFEFSASATTPLLKR